MPQEQLRAIVVPADPVPIVNARVQDFVVAESNTRFTSGQNTVNPTTNIPVIGGESLNIGGWGFYIITRAILVICVNNTIYSIKCVKKQL